MVSKRRVRAFTLVELSVVVTIVGVLAVIAVVGYRKLTLSSKVTEAQNMLSAIRIAQEDYKVERGVYANLGATLCPTIPGPKVKTGWDTSCTGGTAAWTTLPVHVDGPVQFQYATVAGPPAAIPGAISWVDTSKANTAAPWYVAWAIADLDGDGLLKSELAATSFQNTIFSRQLGE